MSRQTKQFCVVLLLILGVESQAWDLAHAVEHGQEPPDRQGVLLHLGLLAPGPAQEALAEEHGHQHPRATAALIGARNDPAGDQPATLLAEAAPAGAVCRRAPFAPPTHARASPGLAPLTRSRAPPVG